MAQQLYFSRDSKMFLEFDGYVWEVPVLDGFSFSQATNSTEITLNEMESSAGVSRRGRRAFNDSLAAGEWSFSTYVRTFTSAGSGAGAADSAAEVHAVEELLWAMMAGARNYANSAFDDGNSNAVITPSGSNSVVNFDYSNRSTLSTFNIYFVLGNDNRKVMKLKDAVVNEASIDFDIDGIATINWSGQASEVIDFTGSVIEKTTQPVDGNTTADGSAIAVGDVWLDSDNSYRVAVLTNVSAASEASTSSVYEAITSTTNFIRNRLTILTVVPTTQDPDSDGNNELESSYSLTLTGGNITITNNISYIIPEELGVVNVPIGHVTGTISVSGSFTCYLTEDTATTNASGDFFEDLRAITNVVTNSFALTFKIGGASGTGLELACSTAHIEIPTHSIEDVISLETTFQALPSSIDDTDEIVLTYRP